MSGTSQETDCLSGPGFFMAALLAMTGGWCQDERVFTLTPTLSHQGRGGADSNMDGQDFGLWFAPGLPRRCTPGNDR